MTSKYIVVSYMNMISGEFVNIGLYTYDVDEDKPQVYSKFSLNWRKLNAIFYPDRGDKITDPILDSLTKNWLEKIDTKEALQEAYKRCSSPYSSLQFQEERASLLPAAELIKDIEKDFLS